jgi:hypothetical protein
MFDPGIAGQAQAEFHTKITGLTFSCVDTPQIAC